MHTNDLEMPDAMENVSSSFNQNQQLAFNTQNQAVWNTNPNASLSNQNNENPIILAGDKNNFEAVEVMEETLSLEDMEKDMISKALKNLMVSEKTLLKNWVFLNEHFIEK